MIASNDAPSEPASSGRLRRIVELVTLAGWILLALAIGSSYVGHSTSPYGTCYAPSGRSVPCDAVARR